MKTMGIVVGSASGCIVGTAAQTVGAGWVASMVITCVVAAAGVVTWDALTDWSRPKQ